jgi:glycyl-tRNA synthetase (class II)
MSAGWVECVGIADRSAFDLMVRMLVDVPACASLETGGGSVT